ncbi:uncharacterized protein LOC120333254 isoform X1 [Styela clava]
MDSVKVAIRIRPLISREQGSDILWTADTHQIKLKEGKSKPYIFDRVFDSDEITGEVYEEIVEPIVQSAMGGFNGTVFAYGQTSSGKTYTMMGDRRNLGIIPLSVNDTFALIQKTPEREFLLRVSYMEIYNEVVRDLLAPTTEGPGLQIREDEFRNAVVQGLTEKLVMSSKEVLKLMESGDKRRHTGCTNMNERSSRSHTIFRMIIESRERAEHDSTRDSIDNDSAVKVSQLNLVDLAGSERASQTGAEGQRLKEGCHINKSLSTLGLVINQICKASESGQSAQFISYRDSKLTRILQPSLGGNSLTAIICAVTPASADDTDSTLRFASSAKKIKNKPHVNEVLSDEALLYRQKREINQLKKKIQMLQLNSGKKQTAELETMLEEKDKLQKEQEEKIQTLKNIILVSTQPADSKRQRAIRRETWCPGKLAAAPRSPRMDATLMNQSSFYQKLDQTVISAEYEPIKKRARFFDLPTTTKSAQQEIKPMTPGSKLRADEASDKFETLEDEVVRMRKRQEDLEDELLEVRAAKNKHLQERESLNLKMMRMQGEITAQRETLDDVIEEKNQIEDEKKKLESKIKDQNLKISDYVRRESQWENSNPDVRALRNENMDLCDQLREVCSQNRKLQEKADEEQDSIEYLKSMLEEVNKDAKEKEKSLDSQLEQYKNQVSVLQTQLEATFANNSHSPTALVDVNKLEDELKTTKAELDEKNSELEEQKHKNLLLTSKLEEEKSGFKSHQEEDSTNKDEEIENLLKMWEEQVQENANLKKQLESEKKDSVLATENEKLLMDIEKLKIETGKLEQEIVYKDQEISKQKKSLEQNSADKSQTMNESVKVGEKTFGEALGQCEVLMEQRDDARNNCKILREELEKLRAENELMKSPNRRADLDESVKFGEKSMNDALAACENLIEDRDQIKMEFDDFKSEFEKLKSECEQLKKKIVVMEEHEEFIQTEKEILFEEEKENLQRITNLQEQIEELKSEIEKLRNDNSNSSDTQTTTTDKDLEAELQHLREEICNLLKSSEDAQVMLQESNKNLAIANTTVDSQKVEIEKLEKELKRVKSDVDSFDTMAELTKDKYERRIKELTDQLQNAYNQLGSDVPQEVAVQDSSQLDELKIQLDEKESEIQNLNGKLQSSNAEIEEIRTQLDICEEKVSKMSQIDSLERDSIQQTNENSELSTFLLEKNLNLESLKSKLEEADSLIAEKMKILEECEAGSKRISELEEELRILKEDVEHVAEMKMKIEELEKAICEKDAELEVSKTHLDEAKNDEDVSKLDSLTHLLQEKESQNSSILEKMNEMESVLSQKDENIRILQENLDAAVGKQEELAKLQQDVFLTSFSEDCTEKVLREELANARRELSEMRENYSKLHTKTEHAQGALLAETNRELDQQRLLQRSEQQRRESTLEFANERELSNKQINELLSKISDLQSSLCKSNVEKDIATRQSDKMTEECEFLKQQVKNLENVHNNQTSVIPRNQMMDPDKMAVKIKQLSLNLDLTKQTSGNLATANKKLQDENKKLESEVVRVISLQGEVTRLEAVLEQERQTRQEEVSGQRAREKESSEMRNRIMELQKQLREMETDLQKQTRESSENLSSISSEKKLLQDEVNLAKQTISALEKSLKEVREKEEEYRSQYEKIQAEFGSTKTNLEDAESKIQEDERNIESLKDQLNHLTKLLEKEKEKFSQVNNQQTLLITELESFREELEKSKNLLKDEENRNDLLRQNLDQVKEKLDLARQGMDDVRSEIFAQENCKQEELMKELRQIQDEMYELKAEKEELENRMQDMDEKWKTEKTEKKECEVQISNMQEQLSKMQEERDSLTTLKCELEDKACAAQNSIEQLQNEKKTKIQDELLKNEENPSNNLQVESEDKMLQIQDELRDLQNEKDSLIEKVSNLEKERDNLSNKLEEMQNKDGQEDVEVNYKNLQEEYDASLKEKGMLRARAQELEKEVQLKNEQISSFENQLENDEKTEETEESSVTNEELLNKISDLESELEEIIMAKEEASRFLEDAKENHEKIIIEMSEVIQKKDDEIKILEENLSKNTESESVTAKEGLDDLKSNLTEKESEILDCRQQIDSLEKKCESLQQEISQRKVSNKDDDGIGFAADLDQELIDNLYDQVAELKIQINEKDEQIAELLNSLESMKAGNTLRTSDIGLQQENENLKSKIHDLTEGMKLKEEEFSNEIQSYSEQNEKLLKEICEGNQSNEIFSSETLKQKDEEILNLNAEIERMNCSQKDLDEKISELSTQLQEKVSELNVFQQKTTELEEKSQVMKNNLEQREMELLAEIKKKTEIIASLEAMKEVLENKLNDEKTDYEKQDVSRDEEILLNNSGNERNDVEKDENNEKTQNLPNLEDELQERISEIKLKDKEIEELLKHKKEAHLKISELETLCSSEQEAMSELKRQLLDLSKSLEKEDAKITDLKKTKTDLEEELHSIKQDREKVLEEIGQLKQDLEKKDSEIDKVREGLGIQENLNLEEVTSEKVYLEEKCACLQESIKSMEEMIEELKTNQNESYAENEKLQEEISELRKTKDDLQILKSDLEDQLDELSKMLKKYEESENSKNKEIALLQTDLEIEKEKSSSLDSELKSMFDMIRDKASMMEESALSRDALEKEVEILKQEIADSNIKLEEKNLEEVGRIQKEEELSYENPNLRDSKDSLTSELEVANNLNLNLEKMLLATQNKVRELESEISEMKNLKDSIDSQKINTVDLESKMQENIQDLKTQILDLTESKENLTFEMNEAKSEKSALEEKLKEFEESQSTDLELEKATHQELSEELELLKTKLESAMKEKEFSGQNIEKLKLEMVELTKKHEDELEILKSKENRNLSELEQIKNQLKNSEKKAHTCLEEVKGLLYKKELEVQTLRSEVNKWAVRHEEDKSDLEKAIKAAKDEISTRNEKNSLEVFKLEEKLQKAYEVEKELENLKESYSEMESKYMSENKKCQDLILQLSEAKDISSKKTMNKSTLVEYEKKYEKCLQNLTQEQEKSKNLTDEITAMQVEFKKKLDEATEKANTDCSKLNLRIDSLEEGLMEADKEIEDEKKKYEELQKKFEENEKNHNRVGATRTRRSDKMNGEVDILKENLQKCDVKYKEEKQKTQALTTQLKTERKRCAELVARLEHATVRNKTKHAGLDTDDGKELFMEREKNKSLTKKLSEKEEEFSKKLKEVQKRFEATKKCLNDRINELEDSCMEADQEYEEEKKKTSQLEKKILVLEQRVKKVSQVASTKDENFGPQKALLKEVEEKENMISKLRIQLTTNVEPLEREVNQLKEELKVNEERMSTLKQKMTFMSQATDEGTKTRSGRATRSSVASSKQSAFCGGTGGLVVQDTKVYVLEMEISDFQRRVKFLEKELAKYKDIETKRRTENMELLEENNKYRSIIKRFREKKLTSGDVLSENSSIMNQTMSSSVDERPQRKELPSAHASQEDNCKNQ